MALKSQRQVSPQAQTYLNEGDLQFLRHLHFSPRVRVDGAYTGKHKSPITGEAQEFTDYREYAPGDEIRRIDWKVHGRTDRYIIKLSEQETVMTCYLMVDSSASMAFGGKDYCDTFGAQDISKFDYAARLAAAIAYLLIKQGDKVGLTLFDSKVKQHLPAAGTYAHLHRILSSLQSNRVGHKTVMSQALREAYPLMPKRGVLILISDLLDDPDDLFGALDMYRHRNFEIVLFHLLHRYELELPPIASVNFIDAESGDRLASIPADIRRSYKEALNEFIDRVAATAGARKIGHELMSTAKAPYAALEHYLERRNSRCRLS